MKQLILTQALFCAGYCNSGGRRGSLNGAELAIIPLKALQQSPQESSRATP